MHRVVHAGEGIARRDAYHEQRATARAELEVVDTEAAVAAEQRAGNVLRVAASSIMVADDLPNYCPIVKREGKKARRKRQREEASEQQAAAAAQTDGVNEQQVMAPAGADAVAAEEAGVAVAGAEQALPRVHDRLSNELCDAFADEEDMGEEGVDESPLPQLQNDHGPELSSALRLLLT